ncbi:hypothetical protein E2C01_027501 [Portunus trituberculatus]|uniref:Uncharacterized protein n=1 Tax=Portunus trituberculatus TaxID=210409 RepID=A0A5B7EIW4_PORTR|nr:hypothetical protein [Portunus trituberculatus]
MHERETRKSYMNHRTVNVSTGEKIAQQLCTIRFYTDDYQAHLSDTCQTSSSAGNLLDHTGCCDLCDGHVTNEQYNTFSLATLMFLVVKWAVLRKTLEFKPKN